VASGPCGPQSLQKHGPHPCTTGQGTQGPGRRRAQGGSAHGCPLGVSAQGEEGRQLVQAKCKTGPGSPSRNLRRVTGGLSIPSNPQQRPHLICHSPSFSRARGGPWVFGFRDPPTHPITPFLFLHLVATAFLHCVPPANAVSYGFVLSVFLTRRTHMRLANDNAQSEWQQVRLDAVLVDT
jgi:hypothetical protein